MKPAVALLLALGVLVPVALAGLAPGVHAQAGTLEPTLRVTVVDPGQDLVTTRPNSLQVDVEYRYPPGAATAEDVVVHLAVDTHPSWTTPELDQDTVRFQLDPETSAGGGRAKKTVAVNLTLEKGAPAEERESFIMSGVAEPSGNLAGAEGTSPDIGLRAAFASNFTVAAPDVVRFTGGTPQTVPFEVTNVGNADTEVTFSVLISPRNALVVEPEPVNIPRGETRTVGVTLTTPWTAPEKGLLSLEARAVKDESKGFSGETRVEAASVVPGAPALLAALAVGLAGVTRRRSR